MIFVDSDFIIAVLRENPEVAEKSLELEDKEIYTTVVNEFEVLHGVITVGAEAKISKVKELLSQFKSVGLDRPAAQKAAEIYSHLTKTGLQIDIKDLLIGAIVLHNKGILLTRNIRHFERIPGLEIEKW